MPPTLATSNKIYSVSELNRASKNLLAEHFATLQVEGEISNLSIPGSGHLYFTLKDANAQVRCALFKHQQRGLNFKPANGHHIIVSAQVSLYEARGDYQLIVETMQKGGEGNLQQAFEKLKQQLFKQGLFDAELKKQLPTIPHHIGVITSPTGAAIHDILSVLKRRFPAIPVTLYPCAVQGENAQYEICRAITTANHLQQVDIILLARGGGSLEDLWAFNEESVAHAIANSSIPIISGIGHEVDFTIADFVADLRAATPSAAAEHAVPNQQTWLAHFQSLELRLQYLMRQQLTHHQQLIHRLDARLTQQHPLKKQQQHLQTLDNLATRLTQNMQAKLKYQHLQLTNQYQALQQHNPLHLIQQKKRRLQQLQQRLQHAIKQQLNQHQTRYRTLTHTLNALSPLATLSRGYAIASSIDNPQIITNSHQVTLNAMLKTRLAHGEIISQIKEINHE